MGALDICPKAVFNHLEPTEMSVASDVHSISIAEQFIFESLPFLGYLKHTDIQVNSLHYLLLPFPYLPFHPSLGGTTHIIAHLCSLEIEFLVRFNEFLFPSF